MVSEVESLKGKFYFFYLEELSKVSRAHGSLSHLGQQSPGDKTGEEQVTGGHSSDQQSISPN